MTRPAWSTLVFGLAAAALPLLPGAAPAEPLSDVPRDHPAVRDVVYLWRAGVIRGTDHRGRFEGERALTEDEAVCLAARLTAAVNVDTVRRTGETIDAFLDRWYAAHKDTVESPYRPGHWATREWTYLRAVRPADIEVLDGWPSPLPSRYDAAVSAARILRRAREASEGDLMTGIESELDAIGADQNETEALDWLPSADDDHAGEGEPMGPGGPPPGMPGPVPPSPRS